MRQYSWALFKLRLPKGLVITDDIDEQGMFQTSISFPFEAIFNNKQFVFFDKLSKWIQKKEGREVK